MPLIIDSWLVEDGLVRGLDLHEQRFRRSCEELLPSIGDDALDRLFGSVRSMLPREGRWFPRVEAYAEPRGGLGLLLRRAPDRSGSISLWIPPKSDPRVYPTIKGPDLDVLAALRDRARTAGADDAVLYTDDGIVLEAAHSSLIWWRSETLCAPVEDLPVLPSVTMTLVMALVDRIGIDVSRERCSLDELIALPVWSVNALHGIRPVSRWIGPDGVRDGASCAQASEWLALLDDLKAPIESAPSDPACEAAR